VWTTLTTSHISDLSSYTGFDSRYFTETEIIAGYQPLDDTLTSLSALTVSTGIMVQTTGDSQFVLRSITGTTDRVSISNGNGGAGNPTIDIASTYVGQTSITTLGTIATGTWNGTAIGDSYISSATTWNGKQNALNGTGFVKATGTTISYDNSTYLTTSSASSTYQTILPSGTAGQFLIRNASAELEFFNLELEPTRLTKNKIAVGDSANYLSDYDNFEFLESRLINILKVDDSSKAVSFGMYGASSNSFISASGGSLTVRGDNGLIFSNFTGGGTLALTVDNFGNVGVTPLGTGGGSTPTLSSTYIGYGSSGNALTGNSNFRYENGSLVLTSSTAANTNVIRINGSDGYDKNIFFAEVGDLNNGAYVGYRAGVGGSPDPTMLVLQTINADTVMGGIAIHRQNGHVYIGRTPNVKAWNSTELNYNKLFVDGNMRVGGNEIIISGTTFKLDLADSFTGAYTPSNGDKCTLTYDSSKAAFVMQKMNTYNDGTRTFLIL
jgi:hypothetical protein